MASKSTYVVPELTRQHAVMADEMQDSASASVRLVAMDVLLASGMVTIDDHDGTPVANVHKRTDWAVCAMLATVPRVGPNGSAYRALASDKGIVVPSQGAKREGLTADEVAAQRSARAWLNAMQQACATLVDWYPAPVVHVVSGESSQTQTGQTPSTTPDAPTTTDGQTDGQAPATPATPVAPVAPAAPATVDPATLPVATITAALSLARESGDVDGALYSAALALVADARYRARYAPEGLVLGIRRTPTTPATTEEATPEATEEATPEATPEATAPVKRRTRKAAAPKA